MSGLVLDSKMKEYVAQAKANDCDVEHDKEAGTIIAKDGDVTILRAIQKGHNGPWIARFFNSERITWS